MGCNTKSYLVLVFSIEDTSLSLFSFTTALFESLLLMIICDVFSASIPTYFVMSHNTPVTMLTNFRLVPGHTVTSFAFRDSQNLGFVLELGCKAPNNNCIDIIVAPSHFWFFRIMEDSYP